MTSELTIKLHQIATDGLPDMESLTGRVAFIFDGCIVSGWPLRELNEDGLPYWEANSDVGRNVKFDSVTQWVELPSPVWVLERSDTMI